MDPNDGIVPSANVQFFSIFVLGGLVCVDHSFAYVAHFVFMRDVWIRTQRPAVASNQLSHPSPAINCVVN
jgi:hypothetical protein